MQVTNGLARDALNVVSLTTVKTGYARRQSISMMRLQKHYDLFWVQIITPTHRKTDPMDTGIHLLQDPKHRPMSVASSRRPPLPVHITHSSRHSQHWVPYRKEWPTLASSRLYRPRSRTLR